MSEIIRPSPRNKTASLFITCMVDTIFPNIGISTVKILDHLGVQSDFPTKQTCCGQPAFNAGHQEDARQVARHTINTFAEEELIVTPSGSCAAMIRHYYPNLFEDDPKMFEKATWVASITWELSEYLVDGLGVTDLGVELPPTKIAFHDACHGLRLMDLKSQGRALVDAINGIEVIDLPGSEECCGFGGAFSVKMPELSGEMLQTKIEHILSIEADMIVTGDSGCLAQINGGLSRAGHPQLVVHLADLLAGGLPS